MGKNKSQDECKAAEMRGSQLDKCGCSYGIRKGRKSSHIVRKEKQIKEWESVTFFFFFSPVISWKQQHSRSGQKAGHGIDMRRVKAVNWRGRWFRQEDARSKAKGHRCV